MNISEVRTLKDLFHYSTEKFAKNNLFSFLGEEIMTYANFADKVKEVKEQLLSLGINSGDKVAIFTHNSPNYGVAYFAIIDMGAVVVPLLPDFSSIEAENILKHSDSKLIFISSRLKSKIDGITFESLNTQILIDNFSVIETKSANQRGVEFTPSKEDLAAIVYTSGTTGKSKGVMLTHHNLMEQVKMVYKVQPVEADDIFLSILPLPHAYEGTLGFLLPFYRGASVTYLEKPPTASVLLPALKMLRPTYMLTVPMIIEKIYRTNVLGTVNKSSITKFLYKIPPIRKLIHKSACKKLYETFGGRLRFFGVGGAKLDPIVDRFLFEGKVFPYAIGYGLTETAPLISAALSDNIKPGTAGYIIGGMESKINNPNPRTGEGELWAKGPNVMKGYYKDEVATKEVLTEDGWFKTGDLVSFAKDGRLAIKGRLKNVILGSSGENIYPEEIESVINNFQYVLESLVVEKKGRLVAMVRFNNEELDKQYKQFKEGLESKKIELEEKLEQLKEELKIYVNANVSRFSQISMVEIFKEEFEKTSTMKIKRYLYA